MQKATRKTDARETRHARIRARVHGTAERPRLAVFRSNRYVYAQLINDEAGVTIASVDSRGVAGENARVRAEAVGGMVAEAAKKLNIEKVVFDRGGFRYQGIVASLAEGARKAGLAF